MSLNAMRERKKQNDMFSKRRKTLLSKVFRLSKDCPVDVYIIIRSRKNNQIWEFSNGYIPPTKEELVRMQSPPSSIHKANFVQSRTYPLPIISTPESYQG